jgi:oligopeptide/dipeptide ABC transporter ATP-binding protein
VACYFCDRIGVMYAGEIVEEAPAASLWHDGRHPYTQMLFASATGANSKELNFAKKAVENASQINSAAASCAFAPRCPKAVEQCHSEPPPQVQIAPNHSARCHKL